jgi:two-component system, OmpR family, sensor histidine kinase CssS
MRRRLSSRILLPNLAILIGSLLLLTLAVLLSVRIYLIHETENELLNVRTADINIIKAKLLDSPEDVLTQAQAVSITKTTLLLYNVKILILTSDMKYPASSTDKPLPEPALQNVRNDGGIYRIRDGRAGYIATALPFKAVGSDWNFLLFTGLGTVNAFVRRLAFIILFASAGAALIATLASFFVARRIAGPLGRLSRWAHTIGGRQYDRFSGRSGTAEIDFLADSLNSMAQRLEDYDAAQKTFLQNASHELRTPLMSIQGYAEGIKHGVFADTGYAADIIISESLRLSALVDDLLYLSRLETADDFYSFTPVSVAEVLGQCAEKLEGAAIKQGKVLILLPCPDVLVRGDGEKLLRAFLNLAGNCLRYAATKVELKVELSGNGVAVTVSDDGPGFDKDDLKNMFTRFYKGKQGKYGLGLSIVKAIVEKHGGSVSAANGMAGGAVFRVELPVMQEKTK